MAVYHFNIYLWSPYTELSTGLGNFTFTGDTSAVGTATITDNETGVDGQTLDDNVAGSQETATATVVTPTETFTDIDVNADAGWTLRDTETGKIFEVVLLNGKEGPINFTYTLSEYPLVQGRTYEVLQFDNQPNAQVAGEPYFTYGDYVCFTAATKIRTISGWKAAGDIQMGELVMTKDDGFQPVVWTGAKTIFAGADQAPIRIDTGVLFNTSPLLVSPMHRMLVTSYDVELLFGQEEVFAHAGHLTNWQGVSRQPAQFVTYVHLLFDKHQVIDAQGAWCESLFPGGQTDIALSAADKREISLLLARDGRDLDTYGPTARRSLRKFEAALLTNHTETITESSPAVLAA